MNRLGRVVRRVVGHTSHEQVGKGGKRQLAGFKLVALSAPPLIAFFGARESNPQSISHSHRGFSPVIRPGRWRCQPFQRFGEVECGARSGQTVETVERSGYELDHRAKATV